MSIPLKRFEESNCSATINMRPKKRIERRPISVKKPNGVPSNVVSVAIEREAISSSKDNLVTTGALENENHLSITSIIQKTINVKSEKKK
ncbi:MAG: hypothetical protein ACI3X1_01630 [Eubacteriales bacterium]